MKALLIIGLLFCSNVHASDINIRIDINGLSYGYKGLYYNEHNHCNRYRNTGYYKIIERRVWVAPKYEYVNGFRYLVRDGYWKVYYERIWVTN